jgi:hypothetical protein
MSWAPNLLPDADNLSFDKFLVSLSLPLEREGISEENWCSFPSLLSGEMFEKFPLPHAMACHNMLCLVVTKWGPEAGDLASPHLTAVQNVNLLINYLDRLMTNAKTNKHNRSSESSPLPPLSLDQINYVCVANGFAPKERETGIWRERERERA